MVLWKFMRNTGCGEWGEREWNNERRNRINNSTCKLVKMVNKKQITKDVKNGKELWDGICVLFVLYKINEDTSKEIKNIYFFNKV